VTALACFSAEPKTPPLLLVKCVVADFDTLSLYYNTARSISRPRLAFQQATKILTLEAKLWIFRVKSTIYSGIDSSPYTNLYWLV
jgi:hypothetical protein